MIENPLVIYEVIKMQHYELEEKARRYWELSLDNTGSPCPSRWVSFTWALGSFALTVLVVWILRF